MPSVRQCASSVRQSVRLFYFIYLFVYQLFIEYWIFENKQNAK